MMIKDGLNYIDVLEIKGRFRNSNKYLLHIGFSDIEYLFKFIDKQQKENEILRKLFCEIRNESKDKFLSKIEVTKEAFAPMEYRPIKGTTKQDIYRSFKCIKDLVLGQFYTVDNKAAIAKIIYDKINMEE